MRSWVTLAALFAVVGALGAWVYLKPAPREAELHALSTLKPGDVKRMRLERFDAAQAGAAPAAIMLERQNEGWRMSAPIAARADGFQIERLLAILDARSPARYAAADLARYGLDQPSARLTLEGETFAYGAVNTMTREQYVLTRDTVYAIPLVQHTTLPRDADALISRALFAPAETPVRFVLPDFTMTLRDAAWALEPSAEALSADERNAWADAWHNATAIRAARAAGATPVSEIKVELKDGRTLTLGVLQREPDLVLLRADEGIEYHFLASNAKRLLSPPGSAVKAQEK